MAGGDCYCPNVPAGAQEGYRAVRSFVRRECPVKQHRTRPWRWGVAAATTAGLVVSTVALAAPASADIEENIRVAGDNRYETAAEAGQGGPDEAPLLVRSLLQKCGVSINVVVASGENFPDALAASAKAGFKGVGFGLGVPDPLFDAPVLLTEQDQLSEPTRFFIDTCGRIIGGDQSGGVGNLVRPFNVWIIGGRDAVSKTVEDQLLRIDNVVRVNRIAGDDRYETAAEVALNVERRNPVLGVRGLCLVDDSFNDRDIRFRGIDRNTVSGENVDVTRFELGTATVSEKVAELEAENQVVNLNDKVKPAGNNVVSRQTLEALITRAIDNKIPCDGDYYQDAVFVATGEQFPDALSAGPQAYKGHPILLTKKNELPDVTLKAIQELDETLIIILGGTEAVSQAVEDRLFTAGDILRIGGADRYDTARNLNNVLIQDVGFIIPDYIPYNVGVATGQNFPDALAASSYLGSAYAPLALVKQDDVPAPTREFFQRWASWPPNFPFLPEEFGPGVSFTHTFGGVDAVSRDVVDEIEDIVNSG